MIVLQNKYYSHYNNLKDKSLTFSQFFLLTTIIIFITKFFQSTPFEKIFFQIQAGFIIIMGFYFIKEFLQIRKYKKEPAAEFARQFDQALAAFHGVGRLLDQKAYSCLAVAQTQAAERSDEVGLLVQQGVEVAGKNLQRIPGLFGHQVGGVRGLTAGGEFDFQIG